MEILIKEITNFSRLNLIVCNITKLSKKFSASTKKSAQSEELFRGISTNSAGIAYFLNGLSLQEQEIQTVSSCLATLSRSLMEACESFHYFCMDKISDEEWLYRRSILWLHEAKEEEKVIDSLGLNNLYGSTRRIDDLTAGLARIELLSNRVFNGSSDKYQRSILEGKKRKDLLKSPYIINPLGLEKKERDGLYRLLSNCAHSTAYGMRITSGYSATPVDAGYIINVSVLCSIYFLAFSTESYLKKRWKIAKDISQDDRRFIREMIIADFIVKVREMQIHHINTFKQKRFENT